MLKNVTKTINMSAVSRVETSDFAADVIFFSANIQPDGSSNINEQIRNRELYLSHREEVDADYLEFRSMVMDAKTIGTEV